MSGSTLGDTSVPTASTKQQIDELEGLLERMLILPVVQADSQFLQPSLPASAPLPPRERSNRGAAGPRKIVTQSPAAGDSLQRSSDASVRSQPIATNQLDPTSPASGDARTPQISGTDWWNGWGSETTNTGPTLGGWSEGLSGAPQISVKLPPGFDRRISGDRTLGEDGSVHAGWLAMPFMWINMAYDEGMRPFGRVGSWLAGPSGRALCGLTGIVVWAGAIVFGWSLWMGWTW
jgi:hypothetical protein